MVTRQQQAWNVFERALNDYRDWLVERVLGYARQHGYTNYSSTLIAAWQTSIDGFTQSLRSAWKNGLPQISAKANYLEESLAAFPLEVARTHWERGISLSLFLGMMKYYQQTYMDLLRELPLPVNTKGILRRFIAQAFDYMELACCAEWVRQTEADKVDAMRGRNVTLTNEKLKYLTIFESLHDPVVFFDRQGHIENINTAAQQTFIGPDLPGAMYYGHRHPVELESLLQSLLLNESREAVTECELLIHGQVRSFVVKMRRMLDVSNRFAGAVVVFNDVTELKLAQQIAARADRAKSAFLATASHEIRTPLNGLLGATELLGITELNEVQSNYLDVVRSCGATLLDVLNDVLDYSKQEAGMESAEQARFNLREIIDDVIKVIDYQTKLKPIELIVDFPETLPDCFVGDAAKLRRALLNLCSNAAKFTEQGEIRLVIRRVATEGKKQRGNIRMCFEVHDTGIGIAESVQPHVFDAFTQADSSTVRRYVGTGLGLSICKRLIDNMNGKIGLRSQVGKGSVFWFEIPLKRTSGYRRSKKDFPVSATPLDVLLVDDDDTGRLIVRALLEHLGHRVDAVTSGKEAISRVSDKNYDIMFIDLHMPDMDGLTVASYLRNQNNQALPSMIACTADTQPDVIRRCHEIGLAGVLEKPVTLNKLMGTLAGFSKHDEEHFSPMRIAEGKNSLIDGEALATHLQILGKARITEIVQVFLETTQEAIDRLRVAEEQKDLGLMGELSHRLKSSAENLGLICMARQAAELEQAVHRGEAQTLGRVGPFRQSMQDSLDALLQQCADFQIDLSSRAKRRTVSRLIRKFPAA